MSDTVFILGAGASAEAGAPLMADFLDVASDLRNGRELSADESRDFDLVFHARSLLQRSHSKAHLDIHNLESVFAAFEMAQLTGSLGDLGNNELARLPEAMQRVIGTTLDRSIHYSTSRTRQGEIDARAPVPYEDFVKLLQRFRRGEGGEWRASVITFNYDACLDFACWRQDIRVDYCLADGEQTQGIRVLKLHGSLNWAKCQCGRVWPVGLDDLLGSRERLRERFSEAARYSRREHLAITQGMSSERPCPACGKGGRGPMIVPPTYSKAQHHQELMPVWRAAAAELATAENIFVSGYSLPEADHFFRYLYALGTTSETILRRFWVWDPVLFTTPGASEALERRFLDLLGEQAKARFQPRSGTFRTKIEELSKRPTSEELSLGPPVPE